MGNLVRELKNKIPDSEKITINLGHVDLGQIDLLCEQGFYSNRTDFIRTAIRNRLEGHNDTLKQAIIRQQLDVGLRRYSRDNLEKVSALNEMLDIQVLGLIIIDDDVLPELALKTIATIRVLGAFQASHAVKAALKNRLC